MIKFVMTLNYQFFEQNKNETPIVLIHGLFGKQDNLGLLKNHLITQYPVITRITSYNVCYTKLLRVDRIGICSSSLWWIVFSFAFKSFTRITAAKSFNEAIAITF